MRCDRDSWDIRCRRKKLAAVVLENRGKKAGERHRWGPMSGSLSR